MKQTVVLTLTALLLMALTSLHTGRILSGVSAFGKHRRKK